MQQQLISAIKSKNLDLVKNIISSNTPRTLINSALDAEGNTALHICIQEQNFDMAVLLLDSLNATIDTKNNAGKTPLHLSINEYYTYGKVVKNTFYRGVSRFERSTGLIGQGILGTAGAVLGSVLGAAGGAMAGAITGSVVAAQEGYRKGISGQNFDIDIVGSHILSVSKKTGNKSVDLAVPISEEPVIDVLNHPIMDRTASALAYFTYAGSFIIAQVNPVVSSTVIGLVTIASALKESALEIQDALNEPGPNIIAGSEGKGYLYATGASAGGFLAGGVIGFVNGGLHGAKEGFSNAGRVGRFIIGTIPGVILSPLYALIIEAFNRTIKEQNSLKIIDLLLKHGANIDIKDNNGDSPISIVKYSKILDVFFRNGVSIDRTDPATKASLLHMAKRTQEFLKLRKYLLEHGINTKFFKNAHGKVVEEQFNLMVGKVKSLQEEIYDHVCEKVKDLLQSEGMSESIINDKKGLLKVDFADKFDQILNKEYLDSLCNSLNSDLGITKRRDYLKQVVFALEFIKNELIDPLMTSIVLESSHPCIYENVEDKILQFAGIPQPTYLQNNLLRNIKNERSADLVKQIITSIETSMSVLNPEQKQGVLTNPRIQVPGFIIPQVPSLSVAARSEVGMLHVSSSYEERVPLIASPFIDSYIY